MISILVISITDDFCGKFIIGQVENCLILTPRYAYYVYIYIYIMYIFFNKKTEWQHFDGNH